MQNGDRVQFVSCPELPAAPDSATFYYLQDTDKLYLGSQLIANNVKDVQNSETPGKLRITQFDGSTREIDIPGNAFGIDCYKGKFPLDFTSPGGAIDEWKIYGNSSGPTEVLEAQSILPTTITAHSGNAVDWEIYGNNNPVVENKTGDLPIEVSATAGNAVDYTIYGNDDNGENHWHQNTYSTTINDVSISADTSSLTISSNGSSAVISATDNVWKNAIKMLIGSGEYTYQYAITGTHTNMAIGFYKSDGTIVFTSNQNTYSGTFTSDNAEYYNGFYLPNGWSGNITVTQMLVKGSTAPDHYIPYQKGVGERTAQLLNCATFEAGHLTTDGTIYSTSGVTSVVGGNGSVELTLSTAWRGAHCDYIDVSEFEQLCFSYSGASNNNQWRFCFYDATQTFVLQEAKSGFSLFRLTVPNSAKYLRIGVQLSSATTYTFTNVSLIAGSTAPQTYIPYGYQIPLTVSQQGQTDKTVDIYIGDSPLTEGETVSKTSTGQSIELFTGENTISTTLYNKPNTSITYNSSVLGVGENTEITGDLPIDFRSNGDDLLGYRIYGTADGAGVETGNWFDAEIEQGTFDIEGNPLYSTKRVRSTAILLTNGAYTITLDGAPRAVCYVYDTDGNFLSNESYMRWINIPVTYNFNANRLVCFGFSIDNTTDISPSDVINIMLVKGSTAPETFIPYGYKLSLTNTSGAESKTSDVYIGDSKLGEAEYVDYGEQKIYRRILFMTHNDKHFITKDNKDFCLRRRGYSG